MVRYVLDNCFQSNIAVIRLTLGHLTRLLTQNIHSDLIKNPDSLPTRLLIRIDFCMVWYTLLGRYAFALQTFLCLQRPQKWLLATAG